MDGAESVRSDRSGRSHRSHRSNRGNDTNNHHNKLRQGQRSSRSGVRDGRSNNQLHHHMSGKLNGDLGGGQLQQTVAGTFDAREEDEMIEVQIIPQDDNWGDNTTAITGATSERSLSMEDVSRVYKEDSTLALRCTQVLSAGLAAILALFAFLTPVAFVVLPRLELIPDWTVSECRPDCEGLLISFSFKLLILLVGTWALFFRKAKSTLPRIFIFRAIVLALIFLFTFCYWLFYGVRIIEEREPVYHTIVQFAVSLVDALLFIHYAAVVLLEIRQIQPIYTVKVVRSPDGESRNYNIGQLSVQRAAVWVLEQYYRDFAVYNQYLDRVPTRSSKKLPPAQSQFKFYDLDGGNIPGSKDALSDTARAVMAAQARRRDTSHNDRFYEEQEYARRVQRRKARLISAAEEAFTHIKRLEEETGPAIPMDPAEAAQAVFPSLARALQKYLRITRQQPRYTLENILSHLAVCISHDMSPKAFLERYMSQGAVIHNDKDFRSIQTWALVCDQFVSRALEDGTIFQLKNGEVSLLVTARRLPHFNVTEEVMEPKNNRFVLRLNSETSV